MPIYEYYCHDCRRRVSVLFRSFAEAETQNPRCPRCDGSRLTRRVSRVAMLRSEESRLDDLADPSGMAGLDEEDPKSVGRWMRRMGSELGEDLGDDFGEVVDRLEAGESPEDIEAALPDLGEGPGPLEP
ncbi:MAG: zinc ribbon domain-containing protein [Chloroflexi bacterium]|nr:zinc ribbon domain-containing protein [Chloroflexota bacterium]